MVQAGVVGADEGRGVLRQISVSSMLFLRHLSDGAHLVAQPLLPPLPEVRPELCGGGGRDKGLAEVAEGEEIQVWVRVVLKLEGKLI